MEYSKKDSTISSMLSEYDNVPYMPSNYYLQNLENNRRVYDPSYDLSGTTVIPIGAAAGTGNGSKEAQRPPLAAEHRNKIPRIQNHSQFSESRDSYKFPDQELIERREKGVSHPHDFNEKQLQTNAKDPRRPIPKMRPLESPINRTKIKRMGRVPSCFFYFLVFLAEILLFGVLILSLVWVQFYQGGFAWREDVLKEFNLHPVLMITGFIFLVGHAMLVYRLFGCCNKVGAKVLHTVLYLMAIPCIVVAMIAVFDNHDLREVPIPNLYSLHSWMGVITIGLFGLQFVVGFFSFWMLLLCEQGTASFRANMLPIHSAIGLVTFMLAVATCCSGLTEKAIFSLRNEAGESNYKDLPTEAFIINALGVSTVALGIIIPALVGIRHFSSDKYLDDMTAHL